MRCCNCDRLVVTPDPHLSSDITFATTNFLCSCGASYMQTTRLVEVRVRKKEFEGEDRRETPR